MKEFQTKFNQNRRIAPEIRILEGGGGGGISNIFSIKIEKTNNEEIFLFLFEIKLEVSMILVLNSRPNILIIEFMGMI